MPPRTFDAHFVAHYTFEGDYHDELGAYDDETFGTVSYAKSYGVNGQGHYVQSCVPAMAVSNDFKHAQFYTALEAIKKRQEFCPIVASGALPWWCCKPSTFASEMGRSAKRTPHEAGDEGGS